MAGFQISRARRMLIEGGLLVTILVSKWDVRGSTVENTEYIFNVVPLQPQVKTAKRKPRISNS